MISLLENHSITSLIKSIQTHTISPLELTKIIYNQIKEINPAIDAWEALNKSNALSQAAHLENRLMRNEPIGLLAGIPYAAKDILFTKDLLTTASSATLKRYIPTTTATVITQLNKEDAIMIGKTKTAEFAYGRTTTTKNPWNNLHTAGGSSSGSAAAVSSSMTLFSIGSQTGGSLLRPASFCGLVSMKPTLGRISTHNIFPVSWTLDHLGPMTKTVRDQALILHILSGYDSKDPTSLNTKKINQLITPLKDLKGIKIGIPKTYFFENIEDAVAIALQESIKTLQYLGAEIIDVDLPNSFIAANAAHSIIMMSEASSYHAKRFLKDQKNLTTSVQEQLAVGNIIPAESYIKAMRIRHLFIREMETLFDTIDLIVTPTVPTVAPLSGVTGDPKFNSIFTLAGVPALTIPCGLNDNNLPIGMQLVGKAFSEELLLSVALSFEQTFSLFKEAD